MNRRRLVAFLALSALALTPAAALAKSPGGTGIADAGTGSWTDEQLGYTPEYAQQKGEWFQARMTGQPVSTMSNVGIESTSDTLPVSRALLFTIYHQKTTYNCLPAVGQSIAHWSFGGYVSPTVKDAQLSIGSQMGTTTQGTDGNNALAWVNGEFADHASNWRYIQYTSPNLTYFKGHVLSEVADAGMPMYVRVELSNGHYAWSQTSPAKHATLATGYSSSGTYVRTADPFAHPLSGGGCTKSWDSGASNVGCIWGVSTLYAMSEYLLARDGITNGKQPEWY